MSRQPKKLHLDDFLFGTDDQGVTDGVTDIIVRDLTAVGYRVKRRSLQEPEEKFVGFELSQRRVAHAVLGCTRWAVLSRGLRQQSGGGHPLP